MRLTIFSNLKLSQKGLLLVCLPVAVMLVFLVTLLFVFHNMEVQLNEAARSKDFLATLGTFTKTYFDIGEQVVLLDFTKSADTRERLEALCANVPSKLQKLEELAKSDPNELQQLKGIETITTKINTRIGRYLHYLNNKSAYPFINYSNLYSEMRALGNDFTSQIHNLSAYELAKNQSNRTTEEDARRILKSWIICGVILNITMGILLAISFNKITARRLGLLMDNTMRLAQNAPLHSPLSGNDEIAQLDRFFHSMATALAAAARKERAIIENAVDVICSIDDRGHFTAVNPACQVVWGYSPDELVGQQYTAIVHHDDLLLFAKSLSEARMDQKTLVLETRALNKDRGTVFIRWSLRWSNSEQSSFCVAHDITDRKEIERVKEEFLAMVSHDLRTPLTSLEALLTLVLEGNYGQLSEHGKQRIAGAEKDIDRLIQMINDLLDIEMLESGHLSLTLQPIDLDTVINRSIDAVRGFADQKAIKLELKPLHVSVSGDQGRLVQVCVNLLSNAIKFSNMDSTVTVLTKILDGLVEVQVIDNGPGIPPGYDAIVFERYKRLNGSLREKNQGTGLGLAICKTIVNQHGGEIGVCSEPGKGSTFWFRLAVIAQPGTCQIDDSAVTRDAQVSA